MTDAAISVVPETSEAAGLARYQPANLRQLVWLCGEIAKSGMFLKTNAAGDQVPMTQAETFMVVEEGIEMGVSPLAALRNIYLIEDKRGRKTSIPRADLIAARIQADPRTEQWDVDDTTPGRVTVVGKRHGRNSETVTLTLADIPARDKEKWARGYLDAQDMLANRAIRKIARRYFRDMVLGIGVEDADDRNVIDVAAVEREVPGEKSWPCSAGEEGSCDGRMFLQANKTGGAFLRCAKCGNVDSPPQEVRDLIRGTPEHLTLAAAATAEAVAAAGGWQRVPLPSELATTPETHTGEPEGAAPAPAVQSDVVSAPPPSPVPEKPAAPARRPRRAPEAPQAATEPVSSAASNPSEPAATTHEQASQVLPGDAGSSSPADSEQLMAFLRENRGATGERHTRIRDALLSPTIAWNEVDGIKTLVDGLDAVQREWLAAQFAQIGAETFAPA